MALPILTIDQMRIWERATWASGVSEGAVIARVGLALAAAVLRRTAPGERVLLLVGKGNNGADARAAAPHLAEREVDLVEVTEPAASRSPVDAALARLPALIVDGLFGIGLDRPLSPDWCALIESVNASGVPVLAVDLPSGLNADTGEPWGAAVVAAATLIVGAPKAGLLRPPAWPFTGRLEIADDVGLVPFESTTASQELWFTQEKDFHGYPPPRSLAAHKGEFGHLTIIAGSLGYHGAAVLAVRGAARLRPGLITVFTPPEVFVPIAGQLQAAMVFPWRLGAPAPELTTALLMGPGLAADGLRRERENEVLAIWRRGAFPVIADASVLDWLPPVPLAPTLLRVITPHPGEAARMLRRPVAEVQADRVRTVRELSRRYSDCHVVLKGHQTLVGRSSGPVFVNPSGNSGLAQGGSGDLLAGMIAGLLAQPALQKDLFLAIRYAVWHHGRAADRLTGQGRSWTVEDLAEELGTSIRVA